MSTKLQQYMEINDQIKALEKKKDELRKTIGELPIGSNVIDENYRMVVTETRRFDPLLAKTMLKPEEFERILKAVPDVNLAKRELAPKDLELLYKTSGQTWKVVARDD